MNHKIIFILGVRIDILKKSEVLNEIEKLLLNNENGRQLMTTNPEFVVEAQKDEDFRKLINDSWMSVADGYGIRLASKYLDSVKNNSLLSRGNKMLNYYIVKLLERMAIGIKVAWWGIGRKNEKLDVVKEVITGVDLVTEVAEICTRHNKKIFLLGGYKEVPKLTAEKLKKSFNNLLVNCSVFEVDRVIEKINSFQPEVLLVALNSPRAQKWIKNNLEKIPSVKLAIGVGGAFDYISGRIKRVPKRYQSSFEWMYRLFSQPKRWKRIFRAVILFPWLVFIKTLKK